MIRHERGFNLVEMMVGITIGLLGLLAVTTVFVNFNKHNKVQTSLIESQSNGAMAIFLMERDIDLAGFGFMNLQGCTCTLASGPSTPAFCIGSSTSNTVRAQSSIPIIITDGGANSDTIEVRYGTPSSGLSALTMATSQANYGDPLQLQSVAGVVVGDKLVLNRGGSCAAYQATDITPYSAVTPSLTRTVSIASTMANNLPTINPTAQPSVGYPTAMINDQVTNLGQYVDKVYSVNPNTQQLLEQPDATLNVTDAIVDNIVYLKAELGIDTVGDQKIHQWSKPVGAIANYSTVLAVRVGVVARTQATDSDAPTPPTLVVLPAIPSSAGNELDYAVPDTRYRYKVYYTIIPLRNMIW
jgi:type IV pilus assembly protein PilW